MTTDTRNTTARCYRATASVSRRRQPYPRSRSGSPDTRGFDDIEEPTDLPKPVFVSLDEPSIRGGVSLPVGGAQSVVNRGDDLALVLGIDESGAESLALHLAVLGLTRADQRETGRRTGVLVGAGAIVLEKLHIGDGAVIAAGAVVISDVAAGATVMGAPARPVDHRS